MNIMCHINLRSSGASQRRETNMCQSQRFVELFMTLVTSLQSCNVSPEASHDRASQLSATSFPRGEKFFLMILCGPGLLSRQLSGQRTDAA